MLEKWNIEDPDTGRMEHWKNANQKHYSIVSEFRLSTIPSFHHSSLLVA
jgi:hypothetical protein